MKLLDSNIVIYATKPGFEFLEATLSSDVCVSVITYVEVLGFPSLSATESSSLEEFLISIPLINISAPVLDFAVKLRRRRRIKLPDALVAATAVAHGYDLVTRNVDDFKWISELSVIDPFPPASTE